MNIQEENTNIIKEQQETVFFESLNGLDENDIVLNETAKNAKKPSFDFVRLFALLLSLSIFIFAGYNIVGIFYSYIKASSDYDKLRQIVNSESYLQDAHYLRKTRVIAPIDDILTLQKQTGEHRIEYDAIKDMTVWEDDRAQMSKNLKTINPDYFCWIKVSFTNIDYPVVQNENEEFYLTHSFDKKYSPSGAIFVDSKNDRDISKNRHLIVYGHNMNDNAMFQPLIRAYEKNESNFKNGIIEITTAEAVYYYEIFSVSEEDPSSGYIRNNFDYSQDVILMYEERGDEESLKVLQRYKENLDEEFVAFLNEMKEHSNFQKDVTLDANSKMITLSTCVNDYRIERRFVVRGILLTVEY